MEEKQRKEDEAWQKLREDGSKAKKNQSNVAYDIMTLQYTQDSDGLQQKHFDDMGASFHLFLSVITTNCIPFFFSVRYRAAQRTNMLIVKGDTRYQSDCIIFSLFRFVTRFHHLNLVTAGFRTTSLAATSAQPSCTP